MNKVKSKNGCEWPRVDLETAKIWKFERFMKWNTSAFDRKSYLFQPLDNQCKKIIKLRNHSKQIPRGTAWERQTDFIVFLGWDNISVLTSVDIKWQFCSLLLGSCFEPEHVTLYLLSLRYHIFFTYVNLQHQNDFKVTSHLCGCPSGKNSYAR